MGKPREEDSPETDVDDTSINKENHDVYDFENTERKKNDYDSAKFTIVNTYIGQHLDVLDSVSRWSEAEVLKIDKDKKRVFITYLYWEDKWDEWIAEDEDRMAPLHTHTYYPGGLLKKGQRIECLDERNKWIESFVIDESPAKIQVHYKGFSSKFDEWIPRNDMTRIRVYGRAKDLHERKKARVWRVPGMPTSTSDSPRASNASSMTYAEDNRTRQISVTSDKYDHYLSALREQNLQVVSIPGDGNCLFRSISHQVYGDDQFHDIVRAKCMDYMEVDAAFFSQFVEGGMASFDLYLSAKRKNACWGDDPEIQALCELYDRPAEIWAYDVHKGARKLRTFHDSAGKPGSVPMRVSYYGGGHYDSVVSLVEDQAHILDSPPGQQEDQCIAHLRERACYHSPDIYSSVLSSGSPSEGEMKAADRRAHEAREQDQAALDLAVKRSRLEMEAWGEEDLQTTLAMSIAEFDMGLGVGATDGLKTNSYAGDEAKWSDGVVEPFGVAADEELVHAQGQILRTVAEQSEREFIEKALQDSLSLAAQTAHVEEDIVQQVSALSLQDAQGLVVPDDAQVPLSEDEQLELAMALSTTVPVPGQGQSNNAPTPTSNTASFSSTATSTTTATTTYNNSNNRGQGQDNFAAYRDDDDEEAILRLALAESLQPLSASAGYSTDYQDYTFDNDDEELRRAIEESLR